MRRTCYPYSPEEMPWFMAGRGHGRHHGRHGGGFPPEPPGGPGGFPPWAEFLWSMFGRGPRARRGDVRAGILALLAEHPINGYQIIQQLEERSRGVWRPSPGSVYPTLAQLEDEGLVRSDASGSGKVFELTEAGKKYVKEHQEELHAPWDAVSRSAGSEDLHHQIHELAGLMRQVGMAAMQVARTGNPAQVDQVRQILNEARRSLYRVLAEDEPAEER